MRSPFLLLAIVVGLPGCISLGGVATDECGIATGSLPELPTNPFWRGTGDDIASRIAVALGDKALYVSSSDWLTKKGASITPSWHYSTSQGRTSGERLALAGTLAENLGFKEGSFMIENETNRVVVSILAGGREWGQFVTITDTMPGLLVDLVPTLDSNALGSLKSTQQDWSAAESAARCHADLPLLDGYSRFLGHSLSPRPVESFGFATAVHQETFETSTYDVATGFEVMVDALTGVPIQIKEWTGYY